MVRAAGQDLPKSELRGADFTVDTEAGYHHYRTLVAEASAGRCFFVTEKGLMGIGPLDAASGDMVCVVGGACVPLILRKVEVREGGGDRRGEGEGGKVVYVGDAYVDGLTHGEAYDEALLREFELH